MSNARLLKDLSSNQPFMTVIQFLIVCLSAPGLLIFHEIPLLQKCSVFEENSGVPRMEIIIIKKLKKTLIIE